MCALIILFKHMVDENLSNFVVIGKQRIIFYLSTIAKSPLLGIWRKSNAWRTSSLGFACHCRYWVRIFSCNIKPSGSTFRWNGNYLGIYGSCSTLVSQTIFAVLFTRKVRMNHNLSLSLFESLCIDIII